MSNFLSWSALILLFSLFSRFYFVVSFNSKKALISANKISLRVLGLETWNVTQTRFHRVNTPERDTTFP